MTIGTAEFGTTTGAGHRFEPQARISPYFIGVERAGGRDYNVISHCYVPWSYGRDADEEYRALTERVVIWDTHCERQIQIQGRDALAFADYLVSRDIRRLPPGRCAYGFMCDQHGQVICDPVILVLDERTIWLSIAGTDVQLWATAIALHTDHDVEITEAPVSPVQVQGPRSRDTLRDITDFPIDELRFFGCVRTRVAGLDVVLSRTGWTGELGYEIYPLGSQPYPLGSEQGMALWDAIEAAGKPFGIIATSFNRTRAMESGITIFNFGWSEDINPLEFWRDSVVDLDAGDFIGKQALVRIRDAGGPKRRMVGLITTDPAADLEFGEWSLPIRSADTVVGTTRRHAFSPTLERTIALGLIDIGYASLGTALEVEHPRGRTVMEVTRVPFIDPDGARARA